jgi:hypothetical protein
MTNALRAIAGGRTRAVAATAKALTGVSDGTGNVAG